MIKEWFLKKIRAWISISVGYDAVLIGSELRMLRGDMRCVQGHHEWQGWSATFCGNIAEMDVMVNSYRFRACRQCHIEMPGSRIYKDGARDKDALEFKEIPKL